MKKTFTLLKAGICCIIFMYGAVLNAQMDTLLYENFNEPFDYAPDDSDGVVAFASGDDQIWVNFDEDALPTAGGVPGSWFWDADGFFEEDSAQGGMLVSRSWLDGFLPGNRNWLITPPIQIVDDQAVLHWKSASFQGPRYMDGYSILISTGSNDPLAVPSPYQHVVFQAAHMTGITGNAGSTDISNFTFSPGYIHADGYTLTDYFIHADSISGFDQHYGLLEPHSVSLAQFAGQTIYIAFLHDADDCNYLMLDDILVTGTAPVNTKNILQDIALEVFPNPVSSYINIRYTSPGATRAEARIYTADGRLADYRNTIPSAEGMQHFEWPVDELPAGQYSVQLYFDGKASKVLNFVKR